MKLIDGGNLNAHLARFADGKSTAALMIKIAHAVHHAHQRGILHRDLKPGNILIDADGNSHVSDFGLAQSIEKEAKLTQSGAIVGTAEYMAPEQACGEKGLTTAADVYGLGAILYVLLTGRPPFQGDYNWETLKKVVEEEPVSPRSQNRSADRDLETICLKCLGKDTGQRYSSSAEAFAEDLQQFLDGKPINARRATIRERLWKWTKRRPAAAALVSVSLLGVVSIAVSVSWLVIERDQRLWAELAAINANRDLDAEKTTRLNEEKLARQRQWSTWMEQVRVSRGEGQRGEALKLLKKLVSLGKEHFDVGDPVQLHEEACKTITAPGATLLSEVALGWEGRRGDRRLSADGTFFLTATRNRQGEVVKTWCIFLDGREPVSRPGRDPDFWGDDGLVRVVDAGKWQLWDPVKNKDVPGVTKTPPTWNRSWTPLQSEDKRWLAKHMDVRGSDHVDITDTVRSDTFRLGTGLPENAQQVLSLHPTGSLLLTMPTHMGERWSGFAHSLPLWDLAAR